MSGRGVVADDDRAITGPANEDLVGTERELLTGRCAVGDREVWCVVGRGQLAVVNARGCGGGWAPDRRGREGRDGPGGEERARRERAVWGCRGRSTRLQFSHSAAEKIAANRVDDRKNKRPEQAKKHELKHDQRQLRQAPHDELSQTLERCCREVGTDAACASTRNVRCVAPMVITESGSSTASRMIMPLSCVPLVELRSRTRACRPSHNTSA